MAKPTGFIDYTLELPQRRPIVERVLDYRDVYVPFPEHKLQEQAARCMDCGVPFCQSGCPLGNLIPDWNGLVYHGHWHEAFERLRATNNFPEFTGRICPAPCESACVLGIIDLPVAIEQIERTIVEHAFNQEWVVPHPPARRTGRHVAVIGSGPAGLACADQLNQAGHHVTVFERHDRVGGLLRYGIPDFKLEKWVLDRRLVLLEEEGITFRTHADVGGTVPVSALDAFDTVVLCGGATQPRDLPAPGRHLDGIHFAWDYLHQQNKRVAGDDLDREGLTPIRAEGKHVVVIGGGDTGSDCVGTANRQGAASVTQFELLPMPPKERPLHQPWPFYPLLLRTSSSQEEGVDSHWSILTKEFLGTEGRIEALRTVDVHIGEGKDGRLRYEEVSGTIREWAADLVLLAIGYAGPEAGLLEQLGVERDARGNASTNEHYQTNVPHIFAAGDLRRGQSLVVWAIAEGREAARAVDAYLTGFMALPTKGEGDLPRVS